jgi:hypothetical protein
MWLTSQRKVILRFQCQFDGRTPLTAASALRIEFQLLHAKWLNQVAVSKILEKAQNMPAIVRKCGVAFPQSFRKATISKKQIHETFVLVLSIGAITMQSTAMMPPFSIQELLPFRKGCVALCSLLQKDTRSRHASVVNRGSTHALFMKCGFYFYTRHTLGSEYNLFAPCPHHPLVAKVLCIRAALAVMDGASYTSRSDYFNPNKFRDSCGMIIRFIVDKRLTDASKWQGALMVSSR